MKHVCYFRQALALDERRVKYLPEYVYGGSAKDPTLPENENTTVSDNVELTDHNEAVNNLSSARRNSMGERPHTMEVWFPGTHSDM